MRTGARRLEYRAPDPRRSEVPENLVRWWFVVASCLSPFAYVMAVALGLLEPRWAAMKIIRAAFTLIFAAWPLFALNVIIIAVYLFIIRRTDVLGGRAATVLLAALGVAAAPLVFITDPLGLID